MSRRRTIALVGSVLLTGALLLVLPWTHALLLGLLPLAALLVHDAVDAPAPPYLERLRDAEAAGRRDELAALAWAMRTRNGNVPARVVRRVGALAAALLARHGVDACAAFPLEVGPGQEVDARRLLGAAAPLLLDSPAGHEPRPAELARCLAALETLAPASSVAGAVPVAPPFHTALAATYAPTPRETGGTP